MYSFLARAEAVAEHLWLRLRSATACTERLVLSEVEVSRSKSKLRFWAASFHALSKTAPRSAEFQSAAGNCRRQYTTLKKKLFPGNPFGIFPELELEVYPT